MKKIFLIYLVLFCFNSSIVAQVNLDQQKRLEKHVYYFAADSLNGRKTGSDDNKKVAAYIKNQFDEMGLNAYYQYIKSDNSRQNVIAIMEGSDPVLKNEIIVVGAHYDHLGFKMIDSTKKIYNGADDNASGSAAIIEIARQMVSQKESFKRTIVFVAFDAEEIGLVGSTFYINDFIKNNPTQKVVLAMSLDMVGYLKKSKKLKITGVKTLVDPNLFFDQVTFDSRYRLILNDFDNSIFTGSDHGPFLNKQIPAFHVTTGLSSPYHKPEDDADLIDYEGISIIVDYFAQLNYLFATAPQLESSNQFYSSGSRPRSSYFGLIAGMGSNQHAYTKGTMTGKNGMAFNLGLYGKLGLSESFALKGELNYEFKKGNRIEGTLYTHAVSVPITLFARTTIENMIEISGGVGGYYSYYFSGTLNNNPLNFTIYSPHEYGFVFEYEMRVYSVLLGMQYKYAFNNVKINPIDIDKSKLMGMTCRIGFIF